MARIAGINIPQNKIVSIALTYIHGIGDYASKKICEKLNIPSSKRVNELSEEQVLKIREYIYQNLTIQTNLIHSSFSVGVKKLIFLGSSCIYPKFPNLPIQEEELLSSKLENTNEAYAIAKIAGIKLCEAARKQHNFDTISLMPTNLYGPGDNYDSEQSHVLASLIKK